MTVQCAYSCPTSDDVCRMSINRLDIVWDRIKQSPRESMGTGQHRPVIAKTSLHRNWQSFLQQEGAVERPGRSHRKGNTT